MSYYQVRGSALRRATRTLPPRRPWRLRAAGVAGARSQKTGGRAAAAPLALRAAGAAPRYPRHRSRHCPLAAPDRRGRPGAGVSGQRRSAPTRGSERVLRPPTRWGNALAAASQPHQPSIAVPRLGGTAGAPARPLSPGHGSPSQGRGSAALAGGRFVPRSARWAAPRPFCALRALSPRRKGRAPWLGRSGARRPPAAARPRQWAGAAPAPAPRLRRSALCAAGGPLLLPPPARRGPCGSGGSRWGRWSPLRVSAGCGLPSLRSGRPCPPPPPRVAQPVPRRAPPGASASRLRGRRAPRGGRWGRLRRPFSARAPRAFCARVRPRPLRCQPGALLCCRCRSVPLASPPAPSRPPPPLGAEEARDLRHRCGGDGGCPILPRPALPALPILRPASRSKRAPVAALTRAAKSQTSGQSGAAGRRT